MRISISNIAWDAPEDEAVAQCLRAHRIDAIDVAPSKYFADFAAVRRRDLARVRDAWNVRGCDIVGMQSLLYGSVGLNLFGPDEVRARMLEHLDAVCRIGAGLGARWLVFGSPTQRDRGGIEDAQVQAIAAEFLHKLGGVAAAHGVLICLEPNPTAYGANFMTTSAETATVVKAIEHPAIRMQLDLGAVAMNGEDLEQVVRDYGGLIGHVHISEPHLRPLQDRQAHSRYGAILRERFGAEAVAAIEMRRDATDSIGAVERALRIATECYRP